MKRGFIVISLTGFIVPAFILLLLFYLLLTKHLTIYVLIPGIILTAVLVPLAIYYLINMPVTVSVNVSNREVVIRTIRGIKRYTYVNVSCVKTSEYLKWRICGIGLPGLAIGIFTTIDGETVHAYTDTKLSLLVETVDGKKYLFPLPKDLKNYLCKNNVGINSFA